MLLKKKCDNSLTFHNLFTILPYIFGENKILKCKENDKICPSFTVVKINIEVLL